LSYLIDTLIKKIGFLTAILALLLALLIGYDAMMRYLFSAGSIALQEVEWHLFDIVFLFGLSYALKHDKHVRVDIMFSHYSKETKAIVQILSMTFLLIPFSLYFLNGAFEMTVQSFVQNEVSSDPGGLGYRFLIKGVLFVAFILLLLQAISEIIKAFAKLESTRNLFFIFGGVLLFLLFSSQNLAFWIDPLWLMFILTLFLLMTGFQVAFVFAGVALFFAVISD
jgi:TRAP-type mannitol/chloroaromatic compound transport system permease small subunit